MNKTSRIGYLKILRSNVNFRNLWLARTISFFGDSLYNITIMWLVFNKTGSSFQVGLILVAKFLPEVFLGMIFGVWVDRWNKKRLMQITDLIQALVTGILAILIATNTFHISYIYIITVCLSLSSNLFGTSQTSWLPDLVEKEHLVSANSLLSSSRQIARLLGASIGGVLVATIGEATSIAVDAVTFMGSLLFIQLIGYVSSRSHSKSNTKHKTLLAEIREGLDWLSKQWVLLLLIILGTLSNIALGPSNVLPPMLIKEGFHGTSTALGIFDASIGFGLLTGGIFVGIISPKKIGLWFSLGLGLQGIGMILIASSMILWVAFIGNFILGFAVMITVIPLSTLFQVMIPSHMRGRINSISSIAFNISIPITYGAIGAIADVIGVKVCFTLGSLILFACMILGITNPSLRNSGLSRTPNNEKVGAS